MADLMDGDTWPLDRGDGGCARVADNPRREIDQYEDHMGLRHQSLAVFVGAGFVHMEMHPALPGIGEIAVVIRPLRSANACVEETISGSDVDTEHVDALPEFIEWDLGLQCGKNGADVGVVFGSSAS